MTGPSVKSEQSAGPIWRTLRFRLAVWNALAVILTALVTLIGLRQGVSWALLRELDQVLLDDAQDIGTLIERTPSNEERQLRDDLDRMATSHQHHGWYVKLFDGAGQQVWATKDARPKLPHPSFAADRKPITFEGYRIVQQQVKTPIADVKFIRVGATLDRIDEDMARIDRWVLLAAGAVLLTAPLCGYWLASRAAQTIREIITTASRLRPSYLEERLSIQIGRAS